MSNQPIAEEASKRIRMRPTIEECAVAVLEKSGSPMTLTEIFDGVLKMRPTGGKTPRNTVYSVLYKCESIIRLGDGFFDLKDRPEKKG